jgi:hypothetical protein
MERERLAIRGTELDDLYQIATIDTSGLVGPGALEADFLRRFARTLTRGGQPFAILGISPLWKGCAQAWSFIDNSAILGDYSASRFIFEHAKEGMDLMQKQLSLHRMSLSVVCDDPIAIRFAEHLGFIQEAKLSQYGPDRKDHFFYSKWWE